MIPVNRPEVAPEDIDAVVRTLSETWISGESPTVRAFEEALSNALGVRHAVAVATGTTACDLVTEAVGIDARSKIIAPATTIISTVSHAARLGAKIHVVDVDPDTWCIDPTLVADEIDQDVSAVFAVHLYGLVADMDPLSSLTNRIGIPLIEDAAEAIGQEYKGALCGGIGTAGVFSFYANKTVTAGEGGAVVTSDDDLAEEVRRLRNLYFNPRERFVHEKLGYNARMSGLVAALALSQLSRLDSLVERKRELGSRYLSNLHGHPWLRLPPLVAGDTSNAFWVFPVLVEPGAPHDLPQLRALLLERGVDTRRLFFPLNRQPALLERGLVSGAPTPIADMLWDRGFYLPSGVGTTNDEVDRVCDVLWELK